MSTIAAALAAARQQIEPNEARLLLRHVLGCSAAHIAAYGDDELDVTCEEVYCALVQRRRDGEPIAYLTQCREFYSRTFHVAPGVLIPRPETELLVDAALALIRDAQGPVTALALPASAPRILDLGTGSGCLAITLALELPQAQVTALDVSPAALAIAARNAEQLGARVRWLASDWFAALGDERFDLIVSNPPYIASNDPHLAQGDLRFEPANALVSGSDGLDAIRQIARHAPAYLNPGGRLWFEHGYDQAEVVRELLVDLGYEQIEQQRDLSGIIRISGARKS